MISRKLTRDSLNLVPALGTFAFFFMKFVTWGGEFIGAVMLIIVIGIFMGNIVHLWQHTDELLSQMEGLRKDLGRDERPE